MHRYVLIGYAAALLAIPAILLALPTHFFDHGQSLCLSVLLFDQTCYGCGMTRAVQHMIHFDFAAAAEYNKLSFLVVPALIFAWFMELVRLKKLLQRPSDKTVSKTAH